MIKIENLEISNKNKDILSSYQTYLITIKFVNSETTTNSYILDIYKLFTYLNKDYDKITNEDIYKYLTYLDTQKYSVYSIARKISSIKSFYKYLSEENILTINLTLERPRFYKKLPHVLTEEEVERLLDIKLDTP